MLNEGLNYILGRLSNSIFWVVVYFRHLFAKFFVRDNIC